MFKYFQSQISTMSHIIFVALFLLATAQTQAMDKPIPKSAKDVKPIAVGETVPKFVLQTPEGQDFDLGEAMSKQPTLLVIYRGGWCPYCNTHLAELRKIENELEKKGVLIVAISPDQPEYLKVTDEKHAPKYTLLSDSEMKVAQELGLAYKLGNLKRVAYKTFGVNIDKRSGEKHHLLPVPAAILINTERTVEYIFYSPNYKIRVENDVLMKEVDLMLNKRSKAKAALIFK